MSLVVQMTKDLADPGVDVDTHEPGSPSADSELPLFAAAEKLENRRRFRAGLKTLALVSCAVVLAAIYLPRQAFVDMIATFDSTELNSTELNRTGFDNAAVDTPAAALVEPHRGVTDRDTMGDNLITRHVREKALATSIDQIATEDATTNEPVLVAALVAEPVEAAPEVANAGDAIDKTPPELTTIGRSGEQARAVQVKTPRPLSPAALDKQTSDKASRLVNSGLTATALGLLADQLSRNDQLPESAALYTSLLMSARDFGEAQSVVASYRMRYPDNLAFKKLQIRLAVSRQNYDSALALINRHAVSVYQDAGFMEMKAAVLQAQQNYSGAILAYRQLLQFDNRRSRWWMGLAVAMDASEKTLEAKQAYQQAIALGDLDDSLGQYALARLGQL